MCIIVLIHIGTAATPDVFTLNPHSGIPIYRQLREQVRRMVLSGQLRPGAELPSVRELAALHAVNPMTISKAYSLLEADGLLERNRGKPMTVARNGAAKPAAQLRELEPALEQLVLAARQLQLSDAELIKALRRKWEEAHASDSGRGQRPGQVVRREGGPE
jgi:GntR family transcriptional regulator